MAKKENLVSLKELGITNEEINETVVPAAPVEDKEQVRKAKRAAYAAKYYEEHKAEIKEYSKKYYQKLKEKKNADKSAKEA